jgi:hypothetical protein
MAVAGLAVVGTGLGVRVATSLAVPVGEAAAGAAVIASGVAAGAAVQATSIKASMKEAREKRLGERGTCLFMGITPVISFSGCPRPGL